LRSGPGLFALIIFSLSKPTIFPQKKPFSKCKYAKNMPRKLMEFFLTSPPKNFGQKRRARALTLALHHHSLGIGLKVNP